MHQTHFCLDHNVVTGAVTVWPCLPISRDAGVYQLGIEGTQCFVVHAVLFEVSRKVVLDQDITFLGQLVQDLHALFMGEGDAN